MEGAVGDSTSTVLVSVVIPTYNAEAFLTQTLNSALAQTYKPIEIIVVDDGSTDGTRRILETYRGRIQIVLQTNKGAGTARNTGIAKSHGKYIAFLDADDQWESTKLSCQVAAMEKDAEAGVCYTDGIYYDGKEVVLVSHAAFRRAYSGWVFDPLFIENFIITSSVMVRRNCLEIVGCFNPEYLNAQDYDLWIRLAKRYRFIYLDKIFVRYWHHGGSLSKNYDRLYAADFRISRQLLEEDPEYFRKRPGMVRARFGSLHFRYAWRLFQDWRLEEARHEFVRSLRYRAMDIRVYGYWMATFLPGVLIEGIRRFKRAWLSPRGS